MLFYLFYVFYFIYFVLFYFIYVILFIYLFYFILCILFNLIYLLFIYFMYFILFCFILFILFIYFILFYVFYFILFYFIYFILFFDFETVLANCAENRKEMSRRIRWHRKTLSGTPTVWNARTIPWNIHLCYKNGDYFSLLSFETIYVKRENKKNPAPAEEAVTNTA